MHGMRAIKKVSMILMMIIIAGISSSCQHMIQLPQPVEIEQGTSKSEMLNTLDEIMDRVSEENSLNILFVAGPEAEGAKSIIDEFEASYDIKVNIFETDIKHIKELITSSGPEAYTRPMTSNYFYKELVLPHDRKLIKMI